MRTRKAILPDAEHISRADLRLLGGRYFAAAYAGGDLRERKRLCGAGTRRPHHWMRCAPLYGTHLAEIRSITVGPRAQGPRRGQPADEGLDGRSQTASRGLHLPVHAAPEFFARQGFQIAQREDLPDKIYKDCHVCPRYHCCDEVAMVRGKLPTFAHPPRAGELAGEVAGLTGKRGGQRRPSRDSRFSIIDYRSSSNFRHKKSTDTAANAMIPSGNYTYVNRATEPFCRSFA